MENIFTTENFLEEIKLYPRLILESMELWEWAMLGGAMLWLVILFIPLKDIDRRDFPSGLLYGLFGAISGVCLFFAAPVYEDHPKPFTIYIVANIFFAAVFLVRWFRDLSYEFVPERVIIEEDTAPPKQEAHVERK